MLPILVAILFGIIDAGRFIATRTMLAQAAAAASRVACLGATTGSGDLLQAANDAAPALAGMMTVNPTCAAPCAYPVPAGSAIRVEVQYNFVAAFYRSFSKLMSNYSLITC